jgi:myo-inositol-1(or 4)-monophosphatase
MDAGPFRDELQFAVDAVREAGRILMSYLASGMQVKLKSENNPVTDADQAADDFLRLAFTKRFPADGWLSEETPDDLLRLKAPRTWIVDPLDGTKEYIRGLPEFAISVALAVEGQPAVGIILNPAANDLLCAVRGRGALRNSKSIHVSPCDQLPSARFLVSRSEQTALRMRSLPHATLRSIGSVAYKLALVAAGEEDITVSFRSKNEWDVCAGALLITEAGGKITDLSGDDLSFNRPQPVFDGIVAGNAEVHRQACEFLSHTAIT